MSAIRRARRPRDVPSAGPPINLSRVSRKRRGRHADLLANVPGDLARGIAKLDRDEAEESQGGKLDSQPDPLAGAAVRAKPAQILQREREVDREIAPGDLRRPAR
jgi:hypothetical protein